MHLLTCANVDEAASAFNEAKCIRFVQSATGLWSRLRFVFDLDKMSEVESIPSKDIPEVENTLISYVESSCFRNYWISMKLEVASYGSHTETYRR